jgi:cytochrome c biogenesis protein CcdA
MSKFMLGVLAIVAGALVLFLPDLLRWIVGVFLIVWGALTVLGKK